MIQKKWLSGVLFCALLHFSAAGQTIPSGAAGEKVISEVLSEQILDSHLSFLSDTLCEGRGTSTRGSVEAAAWVQRQFKNYGLMPLDGTYIKSFKIGEDKVGHNVIGMSPSSYPTGKYIIVAAHYDNIGILDGNYYPGADSNASGVTAMLALARMQRRLVKDGQMAGCNIIFVALDAKNLNMAGSEDLYYDIAAGRLHDPKTGIIITPDRVSMFVNLDIIGSTREPFDRSRKDYLIMLGGNESDRVALYEANRAPGLGMSLAYDYYGSKNFTDLFLNNICDQKVFLEHRIKSFLFTSGITMNTNKLEDTPETLDLPILKKRILLIYKWLEAVALR